MFNRCLFRGLLQINYGPFGSCAGLMFLQLFADLAVDQCGPVGSSVLSSSSFVCSLNPMRQTLVNEYQDKCRELHEQAAINAPL